MDLIMNSVKNSFYIYMCAFMCFYIFICLFFYSTKSPFFIFLFLGLTCRLYNTLFYYTWLYLIIAAEAHKYCTWWSAIIVKFRYSGNSSSILTRAQKYFKITTLHCTFSFVCKNQLSYYSWYLVLTLKRDNGRKEKQSKAYSSLHLYYTAYMQLFIAVFLNHSSELYQTRCTAVMAVTRGMRTQEARVTDSDSETGLVIESVRDRVR